MPSAASILSLATAVTGASAAFQGFNYDNKGKNQAAFEAEFKNAQGLEGTNGAFTSARLYTMIQDGTANDPISAIPAAISTKTSLLFGLWASAGQASFDNELAALKKTAEQYCGKLDGLVAGISVGSEDLYRDTAIARSFNENPGAGPDVLSGYVDQVRKTIKGTCLEKAPIGHVDTWTAYANQTNRDFSNKLDWVGMDSYPYYENQKDNGIENDEKLFQAALDNVNQGTGGKELWITETGWPISGKTENKAETGIKNAQKYWRDVGCPRFGKVNTWWFTMQDGAPSSDPNPKFGVIGGDLTTKPLFDLSCKGYENGGSGSSSSSSSSSAQSSTSAPATSSASSSAGSQTGSQSSAPQTSATSAPSTMSTSSASVPSSGSQPTNSQPAGTSSGGKTTPSATPTPIANAAAGLGSAGAAVAAVLIAVAAF